MKQIKAIVADNEAKRLRITFKDGSKGQLTYKQVESFDGLYHLPDMFMPTPDNIRQGGFTVPNPICNKEVKTVHTNYYQPPSFNKGFLGKID